MQQNIPGIPDRDIQSERLSSPYPDMTEYLGWSATFVFVGSYFCARAAALRRAQMAGAVMWIVYGFLIEAYPVIVANLLVFGAAGWTMTRSPSAAPSGH